MLARALVAALGVALVAQAGPAPTFAPFAAETVIRSSGSHYGRLTAETDVTLAGVTMHNDGIFVATSGRTTMSVMRSGEYTIWGGVNDTVPFPAGDYFVYLIGLEGRPAKATLWLEGTTGTSEVALSTWVPSRFTEMEDRVPLDSTMLNRFTGTQPFEGDSFTGYFGRETDWLGLPEYSYRAWRWQTPHGYAECVGLLGGAIPGGPGSLIISGAFSGLDHGGAPMTFEYTRHGVGAETHEAKGFFIRRAPDDPPQVNGLVMPDVLGVPDEYDFGGCVVPLVNRQAQDPGCFPLTPPVIVCQKMGPLFP